MHSHQSGPPPALPLLKIALSAASLLTLAAAAQQPVFTPGNLVVAVEGCGVYAGTCLNVPNGTGTGAQNSSLGGFGDNQAAPLTLFQYAPVGTTSAQFVNALVLPQTASQTPTGPNLPVSGEYGSSSEATLQLSGSGKYLAIAGYGINAATFDANPAAYGAAPSNALAQSGSLTGQTYTPVARVIALIDAFGNVNSKTALYNIFNLNNPRSVFTLNGTSAYLSGQGSGSDSTGGVFFTPLGAPNSAPTAITGLDTTNNTIAQDTRDVQIYNNTLYTSVDTKGGSNAARSFVGTLGTAGTPPTALVGPPVMLPGYGNTPGGTGKVSITAAPNSNGNSFNAGLQINTSPNNFFFATPAILYVADTGNPKNNSATSLVGDGGLQKWINSSPDGSGTWNLAYTLYKGLSLVPNTTGTGTSGLYALIGQVSGGAASGGTVQLFATNATLSDLDPTFLFGISDTLSYTTPAQAAAETFSTLATAPSDSNFKGVAFAPSPLLLPTLTFPTPAALTFGSALSAEQLNATASVPGTFLYTPAAGTVLSAGPNQTLSVTFTPLDVVNYAVASASTKITINPAAPAAAANLVTTQLFTRTATNLLLQITVANNGGTAAPNVILTNITLGGTPLTSAPITLGSIPAGASTQTTLTLPGSTATAGTRTALTLTGTFTGSTFGASSRLSLP